MRSVWWIVTKRPKGIIKKTEASLGSRSSQSTREWPSNAEDAVGCSDLSKAKREASFRTVASLAGPDMYDVSLTAAAWRLTETTREPCALVVSCDGQVEWIVRSDAWRFPLAERSRPVPAGSMAEAVARGEAPSASPEAIDPAIWLTGTDGRLHTASGIELLESTHAVPRMRQVLSLLWVVDEGA